MIASLPMLGSYHQVVFYHNYQLNFIFLLNLYKHHDSELHGSSISLLSIKLHCFTKIDPATMTVS